MSKKKDKEDEREDLIVGVLDGAVGVVRLDMDINKQTDVQAINELCDEIKEVLMSRFGHGE